MKYLLAIFCPFLVFFSIRKPFAGYFSILACLLVIIFSISIFYSYFLFFAFWILLVLWAFFEINEYNNAQNINNIVHKVVRNQWNINRKLQKYNNMQNIVTTAEFANSTPTNSSQKNTNPPLQITKSKDDSHLPVKVQANVKNLESQEVKRKVLFNKPSRMFYEEPYRETYEDFHEGYSRKPSKIIHEESFSKANRFNNFPPKRIGKQVDQQVPYPVIQRTSAKKLANYANTTEARLRKRMAVGEDILNNYSPKPKRNNSFRRY